MRTILTTLFIFCTLYSFGQVRIYSGHIDKYPIQLVTYSYSDGNTRAIYAYDRHDSPIIINGRQNGDSLVLYEINERREITGTLVFQPYNPEQKTILGKWVSHEKPIVLNVQLTKLQELKDYDNRAFEIVELMQPESTASHYFKLLISKEVGEGIAVTGVRIYEKKTDRLIQELELECQFWGLNNITVFDYNFDGIDDFSVFEASYAGSNTSSIYILREPASERYFISEISGISLEFDTDARLIYEHNQCCAGRMHMYANYQLVDNKMVLIEQRCMEYDDEQEDFIEKECE